MSSNYYSIYLQKCLDLAATIVIKSEATAQAQNKFVSDYAPITGAAPVDEMSPHTWKYYLNLAGEYHEVDEPMKVVSMDTLEEIVFSRQNLHVHRATARAYQYGTRQYKELAAKYPTQERLILGILYPIDLQTAIAAPDGKILGYPQGLGLVEDNEYNLINRLQEWIDRFRARWIVQGFIAGGSDELYPATALGIMYLNLVPAIINLRLEACKTNEAHSFHVRQYLGSHGLLDVYMDSLTLKQRLFFYRNIAYIERNAGKREVFEWLVEHIMTERSFPIAEYVMRHNLAKQPTEVYPELVFRKNPLNTAHASSFTDSIGLSEILTKEDALARDNQLHRPDVQPGIQRAMENSLSNVVLTKMLESSMVDFSNSNPHPLSEVLINEWLSQAASGSYRAYVGFTNPRSGEWLPLTVKEAFIFAWYAFCKSVGITLTEVPKFFAGHVQRTPLPTTGELLSIVDGKLVSAELAQAVLAPQPDIVPMISTDAFYDLCVKIHDAIEVQRNLTARQEHHLRHAMVKAMCERVYCNRLVELEPAGTTYASWFAAHNLKIELISNSELALMGEQLVADATGLSLHPNTSLKDLQRAMVRMLSQLSSYSVQITSEINDSDLRRTDWNMVQVGDVDAKLHYYNQFADVQAEPLGFAAICVAHRELPIGMPAQQRVISFRPKSRAELDIDVEVQAIVRQINKPSFMRVANVEVTLAEPPPGNSEGIIPVPGYDETYLARSRPEREALRDIYNSQYLSMPPDLAGDLSQQIVNRLLDGLSYVPPNVLRDDNGAALLDEAGDFIIDSNHS